MKALAVGVVAAVLLVVAAFAGYRLLARAPEPDHVAVYYTKLDGETVVPWDVSLGAARDPQSVAAYAARQAVAGPAPDVSAIRFPVGTIVDRVVVTGARAEVDLGGAIARRSPDSGSFTESGEFKALVWTLTALPGVHSVRVEIDGSSVAALPGGQFELDEPLTRSSF